MELLNRDVQRTLLTELAKRYPNQVDPAEINFESTDRTWVVNIWYLHEQGLVEAQWANMLSEGFTVHLARITHRGVDFLQDDGGLSAILNVVTVKLEANTLKALLDAKIQASALPVETKSKLKLKLQELGSDALSAVAKRLLDEALDHWPDALSAIQKLLG